MSIRAELRTAVLAQSLAALQHLSFVTLGSNAVAPLTGGLEGLLAATPSGLTRTLKYPANGAFVLPEGNRHRGHAD